MIKRLTRASCLLTAALVLAACSAKADRSSLSEIVQISSPAPAGSAEPNLAAAPDGSVYLSWLEDTGDGSHAFRFSSLPANGGEWTTPATVLRRSDLFVNWADFPSLLPMRSGRLVAHWLQKSGDATFSYDVMIAQSLDGGASWNEPRALHDDGLKAEHGFVSFVESPEGEAHAVWLDGRGTVDPNQERAMQLGFTTISADGAPAATKLIDTRICDCCQTSAGWTDDGPVVVYRDRSDKEIRDIGIVRQVKGAWTQPALVHADNWMIEGCPVNGPSIGARGKDVVVAWFTAANDVNRVNVAFSRDGGARFSDPVQVDDGDPVGRVDVVLAKTGDAAVSWLEGTEGGKAEVRLRIVSRDGERSEALKVTDTLAARSSGFPRMVAAGDKLVLAWTDPSTPSQVRVGSVQISP